MSEKIQLGDFAKSIREAGFDKEKLEAYHNELCMFLSKLMIEIADLEKEEAIFMANREEGKSVAEGKRLWKGTESGLRLGLLKRYVDGTKPLISSVKSRLYSIY